MGKKSPIIIYGNRRGSYSNYILAKYGIKGYLLYFIQTFLIAMIVLVIINIVNN